jgi:hypothetical protein
MEFALTRHHQKEKRYGPSPQNDYTSGFGRRKGGFFGRIFGRRNVDPIEEGNMLPQHTQPDQLNTTDNNDISNPYNHTDGYGKYESGYGYTGVTGPTNTAYMGAGGYVAPHGTAGHGQPNNFRYDDGVYDSAQK